jgi:hypothetical protein
LLFALRSNPPFSLPLSKYGKVVDIGNILTEISDPCNVDVTKEF